MVAKFTSPTMNVSRAPFNYPSSWSTKDGFTTLPDMLWEQDGVHMRYNNDSFIECTSHNSVSCMHIESSIREYADAEVLWALMQKNELEKKNWLGFVPISSEVNLFQPVNFCPTFTAGNKSKVPDAITVSWIPFSIAVWHPTGLSSLSAEQIVLSQGEGMQVVLDSVMQFTEAAKTEWLRSSMSWPSCRASSHGPIEQEKSNRFLYTTDYYCLMTHKRCLWCQGKIAAIQNSADLIPF